MLESNLNKLFSRLDIFAKKLNPKRLYDGTYVEGEPFDYLVIHDGITYCFDAKECESKSLHASKIPPHQFNDMLKAQKHGAIVFFLIYFKSTKQLKFIHPEIILSEGKATLESKEIQCKLKQLILSYATTRKNA